MVLWRVALSVLALLAAAGPQADSSVEGVVLAADTGQPIGDAEVLLVPGASEILSWARAVPTASPVGGRMPGPSVRTASDGSFAFRGVTPGPFRLGVDAAGYVRQQYGQQLPSLSGRVIYLREGQTQRFRITVSRSGTVAGRVVGDAGQPLPGLPVQLLRSSYNNDGKLQWSPYIRTTTDDRGAYRLFGATPGRYYVLAGAEPLTSYHPGVMRFEQAQAVDVIAGRDTELGTLRLTAPPNYRVSGTLLDASTGMPPATAFVRLAYASLTLFRPLTSYDSRTGRFEVADLPSGTQLLEFANSSQTPQLQSDPRPARSRLILDLQQNVENLRVTLSAGGSVRGRIIVEGQAPAPAFVSNVRAQLRPSRNGDVMNVAAPRFQSLGGSLFLFDDIQDSQYLVTVSGLPLDFYVKEIRRNGENENFLGKPLNLSTSSPPLEIVLRNGAGKAAGLVTDPNGVVAGIQVVLVPIEVSRLDLFKTAITAHDGRFLIEGIPPGEYRVFCWEAIEPNGFLDPKVLERDRMRGEPVRIQEGGTAEVTVKTVPVRL